MIVSWLGLDKDTSVIAVIGGMLLTLVVMMVLFAFVNVTIEFVAYRRLRSAPRLAALITAVGMSFIVQNISLALYDVNYRSIPSFIPRSEAFDDRRHQLLLEQARGGRDHAARARAPVLVRHLDEAGEGDARRRAGHRGLGDDGHQREPDDLGHVRDRRGARGRRPRSSTCSSSTCATTPASSSA